MSEQPETDEEVSRIVDLNALTAKVDALASVVQKFIGGAHRDATATTQARLDAPGSVADEVQSELDRREAAAKQREREELLGKHDEMLKGLTEKTPETPPRRVERLMGWH